MSMMSKCTNREEDLDDCKGKGAPFCVRWVRWSGMRRKLCFSDDGV